MSSREKILNSIKGFQSDENLELDINFAYEGDIVEDFKANATLAGAQIHETTEQALNNYLNELVNIYSDHFVYKSPLGVAENGALLCQDVGEDREKLFLCNDLIITVRKSTLVATMHDAYEKVSFDSREFTTFIAGPSKTADIEQSLVLGAHGAMGLHIVLVG